jgi:hypothetical protein
LSEMTNAVMFVLVNPNSIRSKQILVHSLLIFIDILFSLYLF